MNLYFFAVFFLFCGRAQGMLEEQPFNVDIFFAEDVGKSVGTEQVERESKVLANAVKELKAAALELCDIAPTTNYGDQANLDSIAENLLHSLAVIVVADLGALPLLKQGEIVHSVLDPLVRRAWRKSDMHPFVTTLFNCLTEFINSTGEQGAYLLNNDPCKRLMRSLFELVTEGKALKREDRAACINFLEVFVPLWELQSGGGYHKVLLSLLKTCCIVDKYYSDLSPILGGLVKKNRLYDGIRYDILDVVAAHPREYALTSLLHVQSLQPILPNIPAVAYPRLIKNVHCALLVADSCERDDVVVEIRKFISAIPGCSQKECENMRKLEDDLRRHETAKRMRLMR